MRALSKIHAKQTNMDYIFYIILSYYNWHHFIINFFFV